MIVILSTFNGEKRLPAMMDAMLQVRMPAGTQIHVVDNASEDNSLAVLKSYQDRLPLVLYSQPVRGKNHCLNLVLDSVVDRLDPQELVVFTDDDVLPCPEWLEELQRAGLDHPECDVVAGRVLPHWPSVDSHHLAPLRDHFGILFSLTDTPEGPCKCSAAWGPNMAIRGHVLKAGLRFDPRFGPNGGIGYPMGSETELMERLEQAGHGAWFSESASVRHMIRASQLDVSGVMQRAFRHGYGVGWRKQRGAGSVRLVMSLFKASRGILAANLRRSLAPFANTMLQEFQEAWALGLARGALYEYRRSRIFARFERDFPDRREEPRTQLSD